MESKKLGELCSFSRGASVPRARMYESGDYLYIHYGDLYKGFDLRIDVDSPQKPIPYILGNERIKDGQWLHDQDIVYVLTSETVDDLGHSFLFNNPLGLLTVAGTETTIVHIERRDLLVPAYLNYLMYSPRFKLLLRQYVKGMKVFRVHPDDISRIEIKLPSVDQQQKTVALLDSIYERQMVIRRTNDFLEQCVMALFGQFYMDKWGEDLPKGWSYQRVEEFAQKVAMGPFGSNIKVETFVDEGVPIISGAHLRGLLLEEVGYNHITEEHAQRLINSMVYPGDIVFTHAGNIGQASLVTKWSSKPKYMISQRQFYLRCDTTKMLPEIPALYFHTRIGRHVLTANSSSTGVPSIAQPSSYLKSIEMIVPDMDSQKAFVAQIEPMLHQYVINENENKKLGQLRDTLLPKLMSGKIDVSKIELTTLPNNHLSSKGK